MTLLVPNVGGAGATFSIGTSGNAGGEVPLNMSLDDMIASRRKEKVNETRRGGRGRVSTVDRSIASGRAKRTAAANARRQMTGTTPPAKKPTQMEVEKEIKIQVDRTQRAQARQVPNKAGGRVAAAAAAGVGRRDRAVVKAAAGSRGRGKRQGMQQPLQRQQQSQQQPLPAAKPPTKKAVNAAVQAFRANGFQVPPGTQMVIRFEPTNQPANAAGASGRGGGGGGGRGRNSNSGAGTGRGGRGGDTNTNNNNRTRSNTANNNRRGGGRGRGRGGRGGGN